MIDEKSNIYLIDNAGISYDSYYAVSAGWPSWHAAELASWLARGLTATVITCSLCWAQQPCRSNCCLHALPRATQE